MKNLKKKMVLFFSLFFVFGISGVFSEEVKIKVNVGNYELDGVIYDTELAQEVLNNFPLTVSMYGWGGREYYGSIPFVPKKAEGGQYHFNNGDITYCKQNNSLAIFYAQTERPNLSMRVIPIGRVTSDLSVFDKLKSTENISFSVEK